MKKDIIIYRDKTMFAGHPAGNVYRSWGDEIIVSYGCGHRSEKNDVDKNKPSWIQTSRSLDGGETWTNEVHPTLEPGFKPGDGDSDRLLTFDGKLDFTHPDFILTFTMTGHSNPGDFSWWNYSTDRGRTWFGPYKMSVPGLTACLTMRTQYIIESKDELLIFGTCQKSIGREGRCFCGKMFSDGSFEFIGWIGDEYEDPYSFIIMPQARKRKDGTLVVFCRNKWRPLNSHASFTSNIVQYESSDNGKTWVKMPDPSGENGSNPPAVEILPDGTWVLMYGCRVEPYGIRCKYSEDEGRTWSDEIDIRNDSNCFDLGYPVAVARADGKIVSAYYFCHELNEERYIAATIFDKEFLVESTKK